MHWHDLVWVSGGGACGAVLRYLVSIYFISRFPGFPWGTLWVNLFGCLGAGIALGVFADNSYSPAKLFWLTGVLGGFTTFSAFGLETINLWLQKHYVLSFLNIVLNLFGGLCMVALGWWLSKGS